MTNSVYITGTGIISSIGSNVSETLDSIKEKKSGIAALQYISTRHKDEVVVAEVKASNSELKKICAVPEDSNFSRPTLLGIIAVKEALQSSGIKNIKEFRTGIVSATSVAGMADAENIYMDYLDQTKQGDFLKYIGTHECGDSTEKIADYFGIKDFVSTINTACSSSANAIMFGARLIKQGILDRVIVGGTDSLSRFTINGFVALQILDKEQCAPFDAKRKGLNLGEGAGFIVLESEKAAKGKEILCELTGYGNSNDAYHQTASSPTGEGAYLAMQKAFRQSGIKPEEINYINAHGTGTEVNDLSEGIAIERIFENKVPHLSSTKSFTGHTLAASGGIEAVLSVLAIKHNLIYPSLNFSEQMMELSFQPTKNLLTDCKIDHVLSNSFGFGGNTSALIFSRFNAAV